MGIFKSSAFICECSRKDIRATSRNGVYPGTCRSKGLKYQAKVNTIRLKTDLNFEATQLKDFVLVRRDGLPCYQLVSIIDDVDLKISHIIRGEDLYLSSLAQQFLARKLQLAEFEQIKIFHHPLIKNATNEKMSKSFGSTLCLDSPDSKAQVFKLLKSAFEVKDDFEYTGVTFFKSIDCDKYLKLLV
jgi:glutamyl-tRNA synthetase